MSNYLPLIVRSALLSTGWNEKEITVYSCLLEEGPLSLSEISSLTAIPISTLQYDLKKLSQKKTVSRKSFNGQPRYYADPPSQLKKWIKGFSKQIEQYQQAIDNYVEQYDFNPKTFTPKIKLFQGEKGVMDSYKEILSKCNATEICSFFSIKDELDQKLRNFLLTEFIPGRIKKSIKNKNIALNSGIANTYYSNSEKYFNETKLIEAHCSSVKKPFNTEINFFNDILHCMTYEKDSAFAMLVQDRGLVSILQLIFTSLWPLVDVVSIYKGINEVKTSYHDFFKKCGPTNCVSISTDRNSTFIKTKQTLIRNNRSRVRSIFLTPDFLPNRPVDCDSEMTLNLKDASAPIVKGELNVSNSTVHIVRYDDTEPISLLLNETFLSSVILVVFNALWEKTDN